VKRRAPRPLVTAVEALAADLAPATPLARVQSAWADAAGPAVAARAHPKSVRGGVVTVTCREAVWAQELELLGPHIIERLNASLGEAVVQRLRCVTGGQ
jgi:predicted nucleic acid-binding Zn ribbon protein